LDSFKVRAQVDEHFLTRLKAGQRATFELNGQEYSLLVVSILPQVRNGQFLVDLSFTSQVPASDIRRGQTLQLRIALGDQKEALLLPAGGFHQSSGGQFAYLLYVDNKAWKRQVVLRPQIPRLIVVIEGLSQGDRV